MGRLDQFSFGFEPPSHLGSDLPLYNEVGHVHGGLGSSSVRSTYTGVHRGLATASMDHVIVVEPE